jgi:actin-like ATPase involved in cell morphogenesis
MSAARNERRQVLNSRDIRDGTIDRFEVLEKMLKMIMRKLVQDTYLTQNFRLHTLREVHTVMLIFG